MRRKANNTIFDSEGDDLMVHLRRRRLWKRLAIFAALAIAVAGCYVVAYYRWFLPKIPELGQKGGMGPPEWSCWVYAPLVKFDYARRDRVTRVYLAGEWQEQVPAYSPKPGPFDLPRQLPENRASPLRLSVDLQPTTVVTGDPRGSDVVGCEIHPAPVNWTGPQFLLSDPRYDLHSLHLSSRIRYLARQFLPAPDASLLKGVMLVSWDRSNEEAGAGPESTAESAPSSLVRQSYEVLTLYPWPQGSPASHPELTGAPPAQGDLVVLDYSWVPGDPNVSSIHWYLIFERVPFAGAIIGGNTEAGAMPKARARAGATD